MKERSLRKRGKVKKEATKMMIMEKKAKTSRTNQVTRVKDTASMLKMKKNLRRKSQAK